MVLRPLERCYVYDSVTQTPPDLRRRDRSRILWATTTRAWGPTRHSDTPQNHTRPRHPPKGSSTSSAWVKTRRLSEGSENPSSYDLRGGECPLSVPAPVVYRTSVRTPRPGGAPTSRLVPNLHRVTGRRLVPLNTDSLYPIG